MMPAPQIAIAWPCRSLRVDVEQDRLRQRHQRRAEDALQQAEDHHLRQAAGDAAQHRGDGEAGDARSGTARLRPIRSASQPVSGVAMAAATM